MFDLTPGGLGKRVDVPNTEYPWRENGEWSQMPSEEPTFAKRTVLDEWLSAAKRISVQLHRLWIAVDRGTV